MSTEHRVWTWVGPKQRHSLKFSHNTFTGGQQLEIDGVIAHEVKWKYKLTGCLHFKLDGLTAELLMSGDEYSGISYTLTVDGKLISATEKRLMSTWVVNRHDGLHQIEFDQETFDVLIDGYKVSASGDFIDDGSSYTFAIPNSSDLGSIVVKPCKEKKRMRILTTLTVAGVEIPQCELLGVEATGEPAVHMAGTEASSTRNELELPEHMKR